MILRALDVETTGLKASEGAAVCQLGWTDLTLVDNEWRIGQPRWMYVNPKHHIPANMSGIHDVTDADVKDAPWIYEAMDAAGLFDPKLTALVAHNARFERQFLDPIFEMHRRHIHTLKIEPLPPAPWICTYKNAIKLDTDGVALDYKAQTLRYQLKLDVDKVLVTPKHTAGPDSFLDALILQRELTKLTVAEMIEIQKSPVVLPRFWFGKHKGERTSDIPSSYYRWMNEPGRDFDEDVLETAAFYLAQRAKEFGA